MSWKVAAECNGRKFGSAMRKQIIMYLADKASDDGEGIWCSKPTVARECELSESGVKKTFREFVSEGILIDCGERKVKHGKVRVYKISLEKVALLERLGDYPKTPSPQNGVTQKPPTPSRGDPQGGHGVTPNNPKTIQKPYARASAGAELGTKFVPQGERSAELEAWRGALEELGVYQLERVFKIIWQNRKEGFLIPSQPPAKEPTLRKIYLELWLKEHGILGGLPDAG